MADALFIEKNALLAGLLAGLCIGSVATAQVGNEDRLGVLVYGAEEASILIIRDYFIEDGADKKAIVVTRNANARGANTVAPIMRDASTAGPSSISGMIRADHLDVCKQLCDATGTDITYRWELSGAPFDHNPSVPDCVGDTETLVTNLCLSQAPGVPLAGFPRTPTPPGQTPPTPGSPGSPPPPPAPPPACYTVFGMTYCP